MQVFYTNFSILRLETHRTDFLMWESSNMVLYVEGIYIIPFNHPYRHLYP